MKFSSMVVFSVLWLLVIYCPMAHMVWGKGGLFNWGMPDMTGTGLDAVPSKWFIPSLDFAGGTVVHISSGISALVCALVLGKRMGYGKTPMPPHSLVLSVIGAALLWVGWFGFNAGSALAANGLASSAFISTHFAAAAATLGWLFIEWIKTGKPTVLGAISGAVAGLVCFAMVTEIKKRLGYDDSLDAFGVHGVGGTLGAILTGIFASKIINPTNDFASAGLLFGGKQIVNQLIATGITIVFAAVGAFVLLKIVDVVMGLRVPAGDEIEGLDISQHGESGYHMDEDYGSAVVDESPTASQVAVAPARKVTTA
jgi:Amt family ammonium transporter